MSNTINFNAFLHAVKTHQSKAGVVNVFALNDTILAYLDALPENSSQTCPSTTDPTKSRRVIHISGDRDALVVLCNDGAIFAMYQRAGGGVCWERLPSIPSR